MCQTRGGTVALFMYFWTYSKNIHALWAKLGQHSFTVT